MHKRRFNGRQILGQKLLLVGNALLMGSPLILCGRAGAANESVVATLAQTLDAKREVIIEGNLVRCEGSTCGLVSHSSAAETLATCRALQRKVGTLTGYVVEGKPFDPDKLAKCNAH
jgi:hypothetical protein